MFGSWWSRQSTDRCRNGQVRLVSEALTLVAFAWRADWASVPSHHCYLTLHFLPALSTFVLPITCIFGYTVRILDTTSPRALSPTVDRFDVNPHCRVFPAISVLSVDIYPHTTPPQLLRLDQAFPRPHTECLSTCRALRFFCAIVRRVQYICFTTCATCHDSGLSTRETKQVTR